MKKLALVALVLGLISAGCKHEHWTMLPSEEAATTSTVASTESETEPEPKLAPEAEPPVLTEVIFIIGVDGMD